MESGCNLEVPFTAGPDHEGQRLSPAPLAGPGSSRRNQRLQLRKRGFRGGAVASRNITPKSAGSGAWSPVNTDGAADGEPAETDDQHHQQQEQQQRHSQYSTTRQSSNILQEVSNSSLRRKGKKTPKREALVAIFQDENAEAELDEPKSSTPWQLESSPACLPPEAPNLTRPRKRHQRSTSDKRESLSDETIKYIEHLESELAAAQTQLSSMTSPTVAHARSLKMRALNAESRSLQEQVTAWEIQFHERVKDEIEERTKIETGLKARVRLLEADAESCATRVKEMQLQLEQTKRALDTAESANVELERRNETFAHLLVTSPIKEDFPANSPFGARKTHVRQKSMLSRFPTTGPSLAPANIPVLVPSASAPNQFHPKEDLGLLGPALDSLPALVQTPHSHPDNNSIQEESPGTDASSNRDSIVSTSSMTFSDIMAAGEMCQSTGRARPSRRMRRFHGGSVVPKPLILSSTSQIAPIPATAPPYEPHESPQSFPFPELAPRRRSFQVSPLSGRRRALTSADGLTLADFQSLSPQMGITPPKATASGEGLARLPSPNSAATESTPRDFSSLGSAIGRNLFEELRRVKDASTTTDETASHPRSTPLTIERLLRPSTSSSSESSLSRTRRRLYHQRSISEQTALPLSPAVPSLHSLIHARSHKRSKSSPILTIFSDLWRSPYLLARRCFSRAHSASLLSAHVNKLQWWLVNFLLGPMVTRRIMDCPSSTGSPSENGEQQHHHHHLLLSPIEEQILTSRRRSRRQQQRSRKSSSALNAAAASPSEDGSEQQCETCPHHQLLRHSPWMWIKFSLTLAFAIGAAIKDGPAVLFRPCYDDEGRVCACETPKRE
ncbi:hypothetical protein MBLNU459_g0034t1 [Dothideomycetes sp. NU459]